MTKLTDILKEAGIEMGRVYTNKDKPPFQVNEAASSKYASIHKMKEQMKDGKFDPKNPLIAIGGWGVIDLKGLENQIEREMKRLAGNLGSELGAKNLEYVLYKKGMALEHKVKGLYEIYQQMNTSQYKRAVTMYKRKK